MTLTIALNADIRIEIFRLVAIQEGYDEFRQPLVLPSLRDDSNDRASEILYEDAVVGYRRADIPIYMNNIKAFNIVKGMKNWIRGVRLIWETDGNEPVSGVFPNNGFKLIYQNNLERITHDFTTCRHSRFAHFDFMTEWLVSASGRRVPPYKDHQAQGCTVRQITALFDSVVTCVEFQTTRMLWFKTMLGPGEELDVGSDLRKLVWKRLPRRGWCYDGPSSVPRILAP
jgi:hypothetical protein